MNPNIDISAAIGVVTGRAHDTPVPMGNHTYTATINTPGGRLVDVPIQRPMLEFWRDTPTLNVYPLPIGAPILVTSMNGRLYPSYIEPPVIEPCGTGQPVLSLIERLLIELEAASPRVRALVAERLGVAPQEARR